MSSSISLNSSIVTSRTTLASEIINDYDYQGAAIYIAVILIWYSAGLVLMLFFRVRPRTFESQFLFDYETSGKSKSSTTNPFARYHDIQADNTKKQILNELKDREYRERLWRIYYSLTEKQNEPHTQYYQTISSDRVTIGRINRKLADIHRMGARNDDDADEELISSSINHSSGGDNRFDTTKFFTKKFTSRRLSGGLLLNRSLNNRIQSQTPLTTSSVQIGSSIDDQFLTIPSTNSSRKRTNNLLNRFTVEKVPENNRKCSTVNENGSP